MDPGHAQSGRADPERGQRALPVGFDGVPGGLPEGVQYSILLGNACVPLIDRAIQPRAYGKRESNKT